MLEGKSLAEVVEGIAPQLTGATEQTRLHASTLVHALACAAVNSDQVDKLRKVITTKAPTKYKQKLEALVPAGCPPSALLANAIASESSSDLFLVLG